MGVVTGECSKSVNMNVIVERMLPEVTRRRRDKYKLMVKGKDSGKRPLNKSKSPDDGDGEATDEGSGWWGRGAYYAVTFCF